MRETSERVSVLFMLFGTLFCVCLITANLLETKQIAAGPVTVTGGLLVFPVSYIINDCVCEVWGFRRMRLLIWTGFAMNALAALLGAAADALPAAPYYRHAEGFHAVFGLAPRITLASFAAFVLGSYVNAVVMSRMKISSRGRRFTLRAVWSTVLGEGVDSLVFFPLAFWGVVPAGELPGLMLAQVGLKTLYEVAALPVTMAVVRATKAREGEDRYDIGERYRLI